MVRIRDATARASKGILGGFELRTDAEVVRWPEQYRDLRGAPFFDRLVRMLPPKVERE